MNINEVRRLVGSIKSRFFKRANAHTIGGLKSNFRGTGLQFKEHQVYAAGDDVRFIDWKLLAKMNTPFIKTFEEERNVEIAVIIDASSTMFMGYEGVSKFQAAIEITCLLYLIADETKDLVHTIILGQEIISVEKSSGEKGVANLLKMLEKHQYINSSGKVVLRTTSEANDKSQEKIRTVMRHLKSQREVVVLSDLNNFFESADFSKILFQKKLHLFRVKSPIDDADSSPYSLPLHRGSGRSVVGTINFRKNSDDLLKHKKIRSIDVSKRYLDQFVAEMQ